MNPDHPHRRYNPLTGQWVLVSAHRAKRPWLGQVEELPPPVLPAYDPHCYLCPGNERAGGQRNADYQGVYVFENDFPALLNDVPGGQEQGPDWKRAYADAGRCRVICYSPRHDLSLGHLPAQSVQDVVKTWQAQVKELYAEEAIHYVQVFENKGAMMGCSNPHPHGQIWASRFVPDEIRNEEIRQARWMEQHETPLLQSVLEDERQDGERVVLENDAFVVLVPYWAVWPFETLLLPKEPVACLTAFSEAQVRALAEIWQAMVQMYDALFNVTMPFSCGWHSAPKGSKHRDAWVAHAHVYPPLLRSATVRKFMVGYEMLAGPQRDLTPEQAAQRLREASQSH